MNIPHSIQPQAKVDLKLGIKSSLPNVKSTISLFILMWEATGQRDMLVYAEQYGNNIVLREDIMTQLVGYTQAVRTNSYITDADFEQKVNDNQLLKSQLEALIVAFELIWRLGKVSFCERMAASAERTGNIRYPKKISYSANMDIIHYAVGGDSDKLVQTLLAWLDFSISPDPVVEKALTHILCVFAEDAVFRMETTGNADIIFNQLGIYQTGLETGEDIDIAGEKEAKGPLRILKNYLKESLNPFLTSPSAGLASIAPEQKDMLQPYAQRVSTLAALNAKDTVTPELEDVSPEEDETITHEQLPEDPKNLIYFGAPGTGKSNQLKKDAEKFGDNSERVTFYPNYSYAQFVGTYKPVMQLKNNQTATDIVEEEIAYTYVPGPFIRQWIKAQNTSDPVLLIIEELNRANAPAVFGDMFQLLDRKNGESEYPVATSEDLRKYLSSLLPGANKNVQRDTWEKLPEGTDVTTLKIPENLYIWATMNSADQGVFPLDTAFKRRWDYKYFSVYDRKESYPNNIDIQKVTLHGHEFEWGTVREKINDFLAKKNVNEDKFIGPYFISDTVFSADTEKEVTENFIDAFCNKVIMYLFEDAARQYRKDMFQLTEKDAALAYSKICKEFKKHGFSIFKFSIPAIQENADTANEDEDQK